MASIHSTPGSVCLSRQAGVDIEAEQQYRIASTSESNRSATISSTRHRPPHGGRNSRRTCRDVGRRTIRCESHEGWARPALASSRRKSRRSWVRLAIHEKPRRRRDSIGTTFFDRKRRWRSGQYRAIHSRCCCVKSSSSNAWWCRRLSSSTVLAFRSTLLSPLSQDEAHPSLVAPMLLGLDQSGGLKLSQRSPLGFTVDTEFL